MLSNVEWELKIAKQHLGVALQLLADAPEQTAIIDLIKACEKIDAHYKRYCEQVDEDYNDPIGTAYENGFNMTYEIEGDWWQEISEALRKLKKSEE